MSQGPGTGENQKIKRNSLVLVFGCETENRSSPFPLIDNAIGLVLEVYEDGTAKVEASERAWLKIKTSELVFLLDVDEREIGLGIRLLCQRKYCLILERCIDFIFSLNRVLDKLFGVSTEIVSRFEESVSCLKANLR